MTPSNQPHHISESMALLLDYLFLIRNPHAIVKHYAECSPLFKGERVMNRDLLQPEYLSEFLKLRVSELERPNEA